MAKSCHLQSPSPSLTTWNIERCASLSKQPNSPINGQWPQCPDQGEMGGRVNAGQRIAPITQHIPWENIAQYELYILDLEQGTHT